MQELFDLSGKTALVTGASRGLGQGMAEALAAAGAKVVCVSSRPGGCEQTLSRISAAGGRAESLAADCSSRSELQQLVQALDAREDGIDVLVNNAGTIYRAAAEDYPMQMWDEVMQVNVNAALYLSQELGRNMLARGQGKIINIASLLSYSGGIRVPAYTASKHAIAGLTKALANEWAGRNVQVNGIVPGYFSTDNTTSLREDSERYQEITARIPAGRWGNPEDLGGAVVFLASRASDYVNGHLLAVDGGWLAR